LGLNSYVITSIDDKYMHFILIYCI